MNRALFLRTWRAQWLKLVVVCLGLVVWGFLMPVVYSTFGEDIKRIFESGIFPKELASFAGGDVLSLTGSIALGFDHPIAVALNLVFALGFAAAAIAGERQRGTLEVLLSRPLSRRTVYSTLAVAMGLFVTLTVGAFVLGSLLGSVVSGVGDELVLANVPLLWLDGVLLFGAFGSIALAASVAFDRLSPAMGLSLAFVIVEYFLEIIGTLWPDAKWLQPYSLFHYLDAKALLAGLPDWGDAAVLVGVTAIAVAFALVVFPRRDLAAPT